MKHKVFFSKKMVAESGCFSPSAKKPMQIIDDWISQGFEFEIIEQAPAMTEELALAHDRGFVDGILSCKIKNGFGNTSADVARSLPYTTGAMLSAARYVLKNGGIACAPCSGFHHAGIKTAEGYCTFNGLMVTALAIRKENVNIKVGILDCDQHYGNGTDEIIGSIKGINDWLVHHTVGATRKSSNDADRWLTKTLPIVLTTMFSKENVDIILYQAGADPHVNDPYGGWLTTEQLIRRDEIVFKHARNNGICLVWNLAGGYQYDASGGISPVLEIHRNTAKMWMNEETNEKD